MQGMSKQLLEASSKLFDETWNDFDLSGGKSFVGSRNEKKVFLQLSKKERERVDKESERDGEIIAFCNPFTLSLYSSSSLSCSLFHPLSLYSFYS